MWGRKKPKSGHVAVVLLADPREGPIPRNTSASATADGSAKLSPMKTAFKQAGEHAEKVDPEVRDTVRNMAGNPISEALRRGQKRKNPL